MSRTETYRRQHRELELLASEISAFLAVEQLEQDAATCRRLLARFAGKLRVHAAMENEALYPELLRDRDPEVRAVATKLASELGPIYDAFDAYEKRWPTAFDIATDPRAFILETLKVFDVLRKRMVAENRTLYPLADRGG
jgi:hypothetical protein